MSDKSGAGRPASFARDDAIARAMQLFWREGYLSVSASDLANAMNIQRSSFYNTFGSKEAVFREALRQYARLSPDAALEAILPDQPVVPAVVATLRELCRVRSADKDARGCLVCNSIAELVGVDAELGALLDGAVRHRISVMEKLFARAIRQGEFDPPAPAPELARAFVTFLLGINVASKSIRSEQELWAICRTFLRGLGMPDAGDRLAG